MARERVAVLHCPATASDDAVRDAVFRAADLVGDAVRRGLSGKRRILIKANMGTGDVRTHAGRQVALSDVGVVRATVALIRQFHQGELLIGDATTGDSAYRLWDALASEGPERPAKCGPEVAGSPHAADRAFGVPIR